MTERMEKNTFVTHLNVLYLLNTFLTLLAGGATLWNGEYPLAVFLLFAGLALLAHLTRHKGSLRSAVRALMTNDEEQKKDGTKIFWNLASDVIILTTCEVLLMHKLDCKSFRCFVVLLVVGCFGLRRTLRENNTQVSFWTKIELNVAQALLPIGLMICTPADSDVEVYLAVVAFLLFLAGTFG
eukprot:CAMPEP_0168543786 /NCGR_PEP_ID=MMETSP0413-20121227/2079_1 /TAXON_ID=136452 /ORGANISM="Filamoeba nolandi, Strain NC-AS-23-1" /LENGTH=182 /DNA_ID=CAMNT_0008573777 /DNA_START=153 /DNA_END=698 /DNA_ORIENTATION=-